VTAARRAVVAALAAWLLVGAAPTPASAQDGDPSDGPAIQAPAAVLFQPDTGEVVYERADTERRPIASTTKLMTALLTLERADLDDTVTAVPYAAAPAESLMGLRAGERVTVRDLMEGLLLASGNDAAATLAVRVSGTRDAFVRDMNRRARELGLRDTHFANPIGLDDPRNYSSAADLAKLALLLLRDPFFARTVDRTQVSVGTGMRRRTLVNRNTLVRTVPWVSGVKTGHTSQAGYVLVGAARRDGVRLVSAVLGDSSEAARDADTLALLRWGLSRYRTATAVTRGEVLAQPDLAFRDTRTPLVAKRRVRLVVRRGERPAVRLRGVPDEIRGPLDAGTRVGTAVVSRGGRVVARVPLVTGEAVASPSIGDRLSSALPSPWLLLGLLVVLACSLLVALRLRRRVRRRQAGGTRGDTEAA
jgi:D-alanyl-D-alanine carboxypeptidase (penicillin-binding protein 5/6)